MAENHGDEADEEVREPDLDIPVHLHGFPTGEKDPRLPENRSTSWPAGVAKRHFGVQFREPLSAEAYVEFQSTYRLALNAYVSELTYLELLDEEQVRALLQHPLVNSVFFFEGQYKIDPRIGESKFHTPERQQLPGLLLSVAAFRGANIDEVKDRIEKIGATEIVISDDRDAGGSQRITFVLPFMTDMTAAIASIAELDAVNWIEEVPELIPNVLALATEMEVGPGSPHPVLADLGVLGRDQIVAVYEGGPFDYSHCWFKDDHHPNPGPAHRKVLKYFTTNPPLASSPHSLFVAGILAGKEDNPLTMNPEGGVACDAKMVYCDNRLFEGPSTTPTFFEYLVRAANEGAIIHNTSWQFQKNGAYGQDATDVDRFSWRRENCLVVGASGNNEETLGPPGVAKNALCVSAAYFNHAQSKSFFADGAIGRTADLRRKPDMLAPGCDAVSAVSGEGCQTAGFAHDGAHVIHRPGVPASVFCGASFATAVASGAAAIVRQYFMDGWYPSGNPVSPPLVPTGALLKAMLLNSTGPTDSNFDYPDPTYNEGWGLMQLNRVLYFGKGPRRLWVRDVHNASGMYTGEYRSYPLWIASRKEPFKVTLVWTEPAVEPQSLVSVVNDLDLEVTAPDGTSVYFGNHFHGGESDINGGPAARDHVNNVEMVLVKRPTPGIWTVTVRARKVNPIEGKPQGFALVVTGPLAL